MSIQLDIPVAKLSNVLCSLLAKAQSQQAGYQRLGKLTASCYDLNECHYDLVSVLNFKEQQGKASNEFSK